MLRGSDQEWMDTLPYVKNQFHIQNLYKEIWSFVFVMEMANMQWVVCVKEVGYDTQACSVSTFLQSAPSLKLTIVLSL